MFTNRLAFRQDMGKCGGMFFDSPLQATDC